MIHPTACVAFTGTRGRRKTEHRYGEQNSEYDHRNKGLGHGIASVWMCGHKVCSPHNLWPSGLFPPRFRRKVGNKCAGRGLE